MKKQIKTKYCGRDFTHEEFEIMRNIISEDPKRSRAKISRLVCEALNWYKADGGLKEMSCRVAMLRMHENGILTLPPPRNKKPSTCIKFTDTTMPKPEVTLSAGDLPDIKLITITNKKDSTLWNEYIHRYHYLGYTPLPGAQIRYMATSGGECLALFGFGAAAWKTAPRDNFIGWNKAQRRRGLHLIVNNSRFLILPWVKSKNLASKLIATATKRLPIDWYEKYKYKPVLLETFVEADRFKGTCYKAANWIQVGQTKGRGKLGSHSTKIPIKNVLLYPLEPSYKVALISQSPH